MTIPAPGKTIGGLHIHSEGEGWPAVVFEAGIAASSVSWRPVQKRVAAFTRAIAYDRAGFGWSEREPSGGTALDAAQDLAAFCEGPAVLVGHSFGGLIARVFQQHYPERVAGLVLVDPVVRAEWREPDDRHRLMLARGVNLSRRGAWLARMGVVGFALKMVTGGSKALPKLLARASAGEGASVADRLVGEVRKIPADLWPAIAEHWSEARCFRAMAGNLESLPASVAQIDEKRDMDDLPLIVLSASKFNPEHAHDAALSRRGEHIVVPNSGHWIQLDEPDALVDAIGRVVAAVRPQ